MARAQSFPRRVCHFLQREQRRAAGGGRRDAALRAVADRDSLCRYMRLRAASPMQQDCIEQTCWNWALYSSFISAPTGCKCGSCPHTPSSGACALPMPSTLGTADPGSANIARGWWGAGG